MVKLTSANKLFFLLFGIISVLGVAAIDFPTVHAFASDKAYQRVVIIGDPHLPGENVVGKKGTLKDINAWSDVDMVAVLGDVCEDLGTRDEYAYAKEFFGETQKPLFFIVGNHDYIYEDHKSQKGRRIKGSSSSRELKLQLFKETFRLPSIYYKKQVGNYLLIFLSPDDLHSRNLTRMSDAQLDWLRSELAGNKQLLTIIFFHAPLKGTLNNYNATVNTENFIAQPYEEVRNIILGNPQIFLWVSGHTHTPATNESFNSPINVYENQVTNIHNSTMNRKIIWTNSLYLYPDKVIVKTYNHTKGEWMVNMGRVILPVQKQ